jgi:hypothetical protein
MCFQCVREHFGHPFSDAKLETLSYLNSSLSCRCLLHKRAAAIHTCRWNASLPPFSRMKMLIDFADFDSPEDLAAYVSAVAKNESRYQEFQRQEPLSQSSSPSSWTSPTCSLSGISLTVCVCVCVCVCVFVPTHMCMSVYLCVSECECTYAL